MVDAEPARLRGRRSSWTSARRRRPADSSRASTRSSRCCGPTSPPGGYGRDRHARHRHRAPRRRAVGRMPTRPRRCSSRAQTPKPGVVGVLKGPLHDGVVLPGANLVVITETDLTGNRVTAPGGQAAGGQAPQCRRPAGADRGRPRRARPARHRPLRRDGRAHRRRRAARVPGAGVRIEQARWRVGQAVRADGLTRPAVAVCRRRVAHPEPAGRQRLGEHQDQGAAGGPRDRQRAGLAVRQAAGVAGPCVRPRHPVAGRDGGRVRVHRDHRPADRHHRGQGATWRSRSRWTG